MSYVTKCSHGIAMNLPCERCDMPEHANPSDPATWSSQPPAVAEKPVVAKKPVVAEKPVVVVEGFDTPLAELVGGLIDRFGLTPEMVCDKIDMTVDDVIAGLEVSAPKRLVQVFKAFRKQALASERIAAKAVNKAKREAERAERAADRAATEARREERRAAARARAEADRERGVTNPNPMNGIRRFFDEHTNRAVGYSTFYRRCRQGMDWEEAITAKREKGWRGPMKEIYLKAESPPVSYRTFLYRVSTMGMTIEEALTTPQAPRNVPATPREAIEKALEKAELNGKPFAVVDRLRGPMVYTLAQAELFGMTILKVAHPDGSVRDYSPPAHRPKPLPPSLQKATKRS